MNAQGMCRSARALLLLVAACGLSACWRESKPPVAFASAEQVSAAVQRSLPLLQSSAAQWFEERSCVSCHHHSLGMASVALAAERGFATDASLFAEQAEWGRPGEADRLEDLLQGDPSSHAAGINGQLGMGYKMFALATAKLAANGHTDARARFLLDKQGPEGRWRSVSHRPPLEDNDMTATALAVRAIQLYAPPGHAPVVSSAVKLARHWLAQAQPSSNEERTMQLLGLAWSAADAGRIRAARSELISQQRSDGGWAQLATRASDAYATGQALVALNQAGGLSVDDACYQRGVAFLLTTQQADGSWYLATRRRGDGLAHFETGFPHGKHQFIAYAGSAWATMALTLTVQPGPSPIWTSTAALPRAAQQECLSPLVQAALFGELAQVRELLDAGVDANQAGPRGFSALMGAIRDRDKALLLLERGARVDARSELGFTALILASGTPAGQGVAELLLQRGADLHARAKDGASALSRAVESGDCDWVTALLRAGAPVDAPSVMDLPALHLAVWQGDAAMLRTLLAHGADPDGGPPPPGDEQAGTPLIAAASDGFSLVVSVLLQAGARVEAADELGRTALAWAAIVDWGDDRTLSTLLEHGASPLARDKEGVSVLEHARNSAKRSALALLEQHGGHSR